MPDQAGEDERDDEVTGQGAEPEPQWAVRADERYDGVDQPQSRDSESGEAMQLPDWSTQPLDELLDTELDTVLREGVDLLPEDDREVFVKRDIVGLSNQEVAEELGLTVAAVKSRLHRARMKLRDRLNRYFSDRLSRRARRSGH